MAALRMLLLLVVSCGQVDPSAEKPTQLLADPYVDGTYGFSIRAPKGWQVIRQRVPEARGVTPLRMVHQIARNRVEEMKLKQTSTTRPVSMSEMLNEVRHALELEFSNVEVLSQQVQEIAGRPGAFLSATFWREGFKWLRLEAIIESGPQRYFVLLYNGPAEVQQRSEPLFHLVLASLRLLENEFSETELKEALAAGKEWMSGIGVDDLRKAIVPDEFLKFEVEGKTLGFVRIRQSERAIKGRQGVRIRERAWMFEHDGRVRRLQSNMSVSYDLREEEWKTSVTTLVPAQEARPAYLEIALEEGLRAKDVLLTSQVYQLGLPTTQNPPLEVPGPYMPRALARMLPRLLDDLSKPRLLAFVEFDHQRVDMVLRVVESKGGSKLPGGATRGKVYRIEQREGLAGEPSVMYVDGAGRIRMVRAGSLTMVPATSDELETLFKSRVTVADREMARLEQQYEKEQQRFTPKRGPKERTRP